MYICGASSFSYRSTQYISTRLLANAFTRESPKSVQALLLQTRQDSYSAQPPQKRAHIIVREEVLPCRQVPLSHKIVIATGREYCHANRCHSLMSLSLLQGESTAIPAGATLSYHRHCWGKEYCHAGRCHSLISLSFLKGGSTAMLAGATLSPLAACCSRGRNASHFKFLSVPKHLQ